MKKTGFILFFVILFAGIIACNHQPANSSNEETKKEAVPEEQVNGEQMERQLWVEIKAQNMEYVESKIAVGFQSAHPDGARNREQEIELMKGLHMGEYELTDFQVTQNGSFIVVTYKVSVEETIDGQVLPTEPAARLSVWAKTDKGWQWISHANLNPMKK